MRGSAARGFWPVSSICLIGDSQLAMLKLGWDASRTEFDGVELTFFGARYEIMEGLALSGCSLIATTEFLQQKFERSSGGKSEIEGNYDGYVVCGLGLNVDCVRRLYNACRAESHKRDGRQPISDECFNLALYGRLRETRAAAVVQLLQRITAAPIGLVPAPMVSRSCPDADIVEIIERKGDDASVAGAFLSAAALLSKDLKISLFPQPGSTLSAPLRTAAIYSRSASRPAGEEIEFSDYTHMNATYGAIVLRKLLAEFAPVVAGKAAIANPLRQHPVTPVFDRTLALTEPESAQYPE